MEIRYNNWITEEQPLREALCTLGNGYFATRGAAEEAQDDEKIHYPGTYLGGGFNRLVSQVAGEDIENEDLVNWPNWLPLSFRHPHGDWLDLQQVTLLHFEQELDMQQGLLSRHLHLKDSEGRETILVSRRLVSMANPHVAALQWELTPLNWSGPIELKTALDGNIKNNGVPRYRALASQHLKPKKAGQLDNETIYLLVRTTQSRIRMAQAARTQLFAAGIPVAPTRETTTEGNSYVAQVLQVQCQEQRPLRIEKVVTVYTSRDFASSEELLEATTHIKRQGSFAELLQAHSTAWQHLWRRCDIVLGCNDQVQPVLRLHIFHLLQTVSPNTVDLDVGVPARGLHGEAYRGHIFWDELFIFPFLNLRLPELTRELLMYRYRRLGEARHLAQESGYRGAMFPWQSGSNGREESQVVHLNPKSGNWVPDNTHLQRHISAAVAYNVWQYYQATHDREFLYTHGAELLLDIAQFWSTIATFNQKRQRYEICHIVGPDEYHTGYPDSEEPGLNNNAYTNMLAVWVIHTALGLFKIVDNSQLQELLERLHISESELERWRDISRKMYIPFLPESEIIAQFEGYEKLQEFDWDRYKQEYGESMRLDRILESEGDSVNNYKASKQADVLMLFFLFSEAELQQIFESLGYTLTPAQIAENIAYYEARTSHGSTLSKIVHAWVLARSDRKRSWQNFREALMSDVEDVQGGTTQEGIHLGAMAGTVDLVQRAYTGLEIRDDVLWLDPVLPQEMACATMQLQYRGHWIKLEVTLQQLTIRFDRGRTHEVQIGVQGQVYTFTTGETRAFDLKK